MAIRFYTGKPGAGMWYHSLPPLARHRRLFASHVRAARWVWFGCGCAIGIGLLTLLGELVR